MWKKLGAGERGMAVHTRPGAFTVSIFINASPIPTSHAFVENVHR